MNPPLRLKDLFRWRGKAKQEPETSTYEQMTEVVELAVDFDKLQALPVWEKLLTRMGAEVNSELVEATKYKYEPTRQTAHTVRWDAKRELLDNTLGWIEATQRERDRIVSEFREIRNGTARDNA